MNPTLPQHKSKLNVLHFLLLTWPYFLNDIPIILWAQSHRTAICSMSIFTNLIYPLGILLLFHKRHIIDLNKIFRIKEWKPLQFLLIWGFGVAFAVVVIDYGLNTKLMEPLFKRSYGYYLPTNKILFWFFSIVGAINAGLMEETIFRGYLFDKLARYSDAAKLLISSVLFALIHWCMGPGFLVTAFAYGLFFGIIYLKTKNIYLVILIHLSTNLIL